MALICLLALLNKDLDFYAKRQFDNIVKQVDYNCCYVFNMLINVYNLQV